MDSATAKTAESRMAKAMLRENEILKRVVSEYMQRDMERDKLYYSDIEVRRGRVVLFQCT